MDQGTRNELRDAIEYAIKIESGDLRSTLADFDPPRAIRWAMADAAVAVLEAFERGIVVGKETADDEKFRAWLRRRYGFSDD